MWWLWCDPTILPEKPTSTKWLGISTKWLRISIATSASPPTMTECRFYLGWGGQIHRHGLPSSVLPPSNKRHCLVALPFMVGEFIFSSTEHRQRGLSWDTHSSVFSSRSSTAYRSGVAARFMHSIRVHGRSIIILFSVWRVSSSIPIIVVAFAIYLGCIWVCDHVVHCIMELRFISAVGLPFLSMGILARKIVLTGIGVGIMRDLPQLFISLLRGHDWLHSSVLILGHFDIGLGTKKRNLMGGYHCWSPNPFDLWGIKWIFFLCFIPIEPFPLGTSTKEQDCFFRDGDSNFSHFTFQLLLCDVEYEGLFPYMAREAVRSCLLSCANITDIYM